MRWALKPTSTLARITSALKAVLIMKQSGSQGFALHRTATRRSNPENVVAQLGKFSRSSVPAYSWKLLRQAPNIWALCSPRYPV
jgi:hypothetical protein